MIDDETAALRQVGDGKAAIAEQLARLWAPGPDVPEEFLPEDLGPEALEGLIVRWLVTTRKTVTVWGHTPRPLADPLILATMEDVIDVCINTHVPESAIVPLLRLAKQGFPLAVRVHELSSS